MKSFVISINRGQSFWHIQEIFNSITFPAGRGSLDVATRFPFRSAAERTIKKQKLINKFFSVAVIPVED